MAPVPEDWSTLSALNPEFKELLKPFPHSPQRTEKTTIESLRAGGGKTLSALATDMLLSSNSRCRRRIIGTLSNGSPAMPTLSTQTEPKKGFILGGSSSGATCTMVSSHLYRDEGLSPPLTGLYLCVPVPCIHSALPEPYASDKRILSWEQNANAPIFNFAVFKLLEEAYQAPDNDPQRSPFLWPTGHVNLPPTYIQVARLDFSRDYALLYEKILREEGVKTKIDVFPGLPHAFWAFFRKANFTQDWSKKTDAGFEWLLKEGKVEE